MQNHTGIIQNNRNTYAVFYRLVDLITIHLALFAALKIYDVGYSQIYINIALVASVTFFFVAESFLLYRSWRTGSFKQIAFYVALSWSGALALMLLYVFISKSGTDYSRAVILIWFLVGLSCLLGWRGCFFCFLKYMRGRGYNTRSVAIFGLSPAAIRLAEEIRRNPEIGYRLVAIYDDRNVDRLDEKYRHLYKGKIQTGVHRARSSRYDEIFIGLPMSAQQRIQGMLQMLGDTTSNVQLVPDLFVYCLMNASMATVGEVQTINVYNNPMGGAAAILKRAEDIVLSSVILIMISIPLIVIAIAVKVTSKGPVVFKQDRYGLDGRKIKVWKFRSMTVTENSDVVTQATKNDVRITPLGGFLRRTSLDELPQFINVLQGQMSVVGPRPHAVSHNEQYRKQVDYYMLRHKVKPGITGWAQINGWRGETDTVDKMEMRIKYDLDYIKNWSLWMDCKIVFFTIFRSFNDKNAY